MTWVGVDDTDGPNGGCTTHVLTEVIRAGLEAGADLTSEPRLVRLNPNIPWKTRGNAALAQRFGRGRGDRVQVGELPEGPVYAFRRGLPLAAPIRSALIEGAWNAVVRSSQDDRRTDPAMVAAERAIPASIYWAAVRSVVKVRTVRALLKRAGAEARTLRSSRGLIGATAAVAWPGRRATWELLSYRPASRWSEPREVDASSIRAVEQRFPEIFLCTDPRTRRLLVAPHTACPILFGLRATRREGLPSAFREVRSEAVERWVVFRTNQASGDHVAAPAVSGLGPYEPGRLVGALAFPPEQLRGGHVRLILRLSGGRMARCMVFEPTKSLPAVARSLARGDELEVWGGRGRDETVRVEGIRVLSAPPRLVGRSPPVCPTCLRTSDSLGAGRGYRCPGCRRRFPLEAATLRLEPAAFGPGTYHPTPSARRHLHPLALEPGRPAPPSTL